MTAVRVCKVPTQPFDDQRPGTAGLRKKVTVFQQPGYLENFVQAVFDGLATVQGRILVVGGDGRYHNDTAIQTIIRMALAQGAQRIVVGQKGLLSTPAASLLIRKRGAIGGFVLTASHNPAGPAGDFGIKFNVDNGGQASETLTEAIYARTRTISEYCIAELDGDVDLSQPGEIRIGDSIVEVVDPVDDYAALMRELFDFEAIRRLLKGGFRVRFDAMHGITGPYARRILVDELGASSDSVVRDRPLPDFGGGHPDPNLRHARELVDECFGPDAPDFGAASDGDGDRNMILGRRQFVSPGDSLAVLARLAREVPGYRDGLAGIARSMPTSRAVDRVAEALRLPCFETPTGWRFFCNLLDAGRVTLCGEESFGTSSSHIREKDGVWAVLFWLNLLAVRGAGVAEIMREHWHAMGRHYFNRHDYEALPADTAAAIMDAARAACAGWVGQSYGQWTVTQADDFEYHDPVDGSVSRHQGLRIVCGDSARIVLRQSGTGTAGATLRLYLERYETDPAHLEHDAAQWLSPLAGVAETLLGIRAATGRETPSLVT